MYLYFNSINPYWLPKPSDIEHVIFVQLEAFTVVAMKNVIFDLHLGSAWFES
jgi:hypothetical protein